MTILVEDFIKKLFLPEGTKIQGFEISEGEYVLKYVIEGGLVTKKYTSIIYSSEIEIIGVKKEYFEHGNGD